LALFQALRARLRSHRPSGTLLFVEGSRHLVPGGTRVNPGLSFLAPSSGRSLRAEQPTLNIYKWPGYCHMSPTGGVLAEVAGHLLRQAAGLEKGQKS
jgi:hypothetical protein